ncbi:MAG: hypothetical protein P3X24_009865 [bacterium]|nr:hypothetical protein [bacterium]
MIISRHRSQSARWAIGHSVLGWLYVLWYVIWGRNRLSWGILSMGDDGREKSGISPLFSLSPIRPSRG